MTAVEFQERIDRAPKEGHLRGVSIRLAPGSDVTDLCRAAAFRVTKKGASEREFTFVTPEVVNSMLANSDGGPPSTVFTTGGPMVIVASLSAETVIAGIAKYLDLESLAGDGSVHFLPAR